MTEIVRPRRLSGDQRRAHIARLIAMGVVADPQRGPEPHHDYSAERERTVFEIPVARVAGDGTKE